MANVKISIVVKISKKSSENEVKIAVQIGPQHISMLIEELN
jgi:hypothetical protein